MMWSFDRFGDQIALLDEGGQRLTYSQLAWEGAELYRAAGGRCLAFCLCQNTIGSILGYAGFVEGGVVPALLNAGLDRDMLRGLYETYHPAFFWAPEGFRWERKDGRVEAWKGGKAERRKGGGVDSDVDGIVIFRY